MTWDGNHDYKKREDYTDQEWKKMGASENLAALRYWGQDQNHGNAQGGNKDWLKYQEGGGDQARMWMDLSQGEQRDYQAKHGDNAEEHYSRANAGNFWTNHDTDNLKDWSEEAYFDNLPEYMKERYDTSKKGHYTYDDSPGHQYTVGQGRREADAYQTKQQEAYERANSYSNDDSGDDGDDGSNDPPPTTEPDVPLTDEQEEQQKHAQFAQGVTDRAKDNAAPRVDTAEVRSKTDKRSQYLRDQATLHGVNIWGDRDHKNSPRPSFVLPDSAEKPDAPDFQSMYEQTLSQLKQYQL